ncbi:histidine utilization repressor [Simiduia sp. 21SJ11W-1]|uniref:histidine utilization repressor n=1 Tax=Simiduia sp. 21SJ11W-1 TaxID=2909669 RepID=UPI00209CD3CB|nr:histidine utilization repressor [Simiduia sp. 21SJ11W-1]UTA46480.1 histidine utilization repressor [Simiduia sp. 21SJ11W-1]
MEPRYLTIKHTLLARIESGVLAAGARVASENELAGEFGVSRMTARRALDALADEGVLIRTQGLGTFVADERPSSNLVEIRNIAEEIHARGHAYACEVLALASQTADAKYARRLGLDEGEAVFFSRLLHFENGLPIQLEERWVNPRFAPAYGEQQFGAGDLTPSRYLNQVAPLTEADHLIEAVAASSSLQQQLQLSDGEPCLKVSRRTFGPAGIVSYAQLYHPGSRFRLGGHVNY